MILSELAESRIALWGYGREGRATHDFLKAHFPDKKILIFSGEEGNLPEEELVTRSSDFDVLIKSPGISLYRAEVTALKAAGIKITSLVNIWFALPRSGKVIAITGTNGKSTTSALLHHILKTLGLDVGLGGNIGTPLLELAKHDFTVVELSSYQTADLTGTADIAVLLNLFPEHIQWHGSHAQYYRDKTNLLKGRVVLNRTDKLTAQYAPKEAVWFNDPKTLHIEEDMIKDGPETLSHFKDFQLIGHHNMENVCAALTVCKMLGFDLDAACKTAQSFTALPHRLFALGKFGAHYFVNDSISTTPEATLGALEAFKDRALTLIIGGQDREQNFSVLAARLQGQRVITVYETGPRLHAAIAGSVQAENLAQAVRMAKDMTPEDGLILLSPAAPSYDAFKNFEERGEIFSGLARTP